VLVLTICSCRVSVLCTVTASFNTRTSELCNCVDTLHYERTYTPCHKKWTTNSWRSLRQIRTQHKFTDMVIIITSNTFCGTWYLPHSHVHNERTVPIIMTGYMAQEREGYISTSGLKSDVSVMFFDPDFLSDAGISAIRP